MKIIHIRPNKKATWTFCKRFRESVCPTGAYWMHPKTEAEKLCPHCMKQLIKGMQAGEIEFNIRRLGSVIPVTVNMLEEMWARCAA